MAAPGVRVLGRSVITVGSRAAVGVAAIGAIAGIVFGTMDIISGS